MFISGLTRSLRHDGDQEVVSALGPGSAIDRQPGEDGDMMSDKGKLSGCVLAGKDMVEEWKEQSDMLFTPGSKQSRITGEKWTNEEQRVFLMGKKSDLMKAQLQARLCSFWSSTYLEFFEKWPEVVNAFPGRTYDSLTKDEQKVLGDRGSISYRLAANKDEPQGLATAEVFLHENDDIKSNVSMQVKADSIDKRVCLAEMRSLAECDLANKSEEFRENLVAQAKEECQRHAKAAVTDVEALHTGNVGSKQQINSLAGMPVSTWVVLTHTWMGSFKSTASLPPPLSEEGTLLPFQPPSLTGDLTPSASRLSTPGPSVTLPALRATVPLTPTSALGNLTPVGITQFPIGGNTFQMDVNAFSGGQLSLDEYGLPPLPGGFEDRNSGLNTNMSPISVWNHDLACCQGLFTSSPKLRHSLLNVSAATGGSTAQDIFGQLAPNASYPTVNPSYQAPPAPATCSPSQPELPALILASESADTIASGALANLSAPAPVQVITSTVANASVAFSSAAVTPAPSGPLVSPVTAPPSPTSQANLASSSTAPPAASTMSSTTPVPNRPGSADRGVGAKATVHSAKGGTK
ncbi:hypothetical protein PAXINDRAFT_157683 [Paxillus involutus ATCC 200175]|uniref:Uncharacterized protein n=1 Tax=Paxillus involutus ATCC 200175 TaxID=664439 RepID=A0A0C9TSR0_PAXIN|nr:hypothetical protein PAXINDRAFT_157683 [Paxillus involutus ATCC 200175]